MDQMISFVVTNGPPALAALKSLGLALAGLLAFVHLTLVVLETKWPALKAEDGAVQSFILWLDRGCHGPGTWNNGAIPPPSAVIGAVRAAPSAPAPTAGTKGIAALWLLPALTFLALVSLLFAGPAKAQQLSWNTPVVFAGPTAAVTELNLKSGAITKIGAGFGYQLTIGDGEFNWLGKSWDAIDVSVVAYGAALASSTTGMGSLQLGGCAGTLNGIVAFCALSTPFASDGSGYVQGGSPGLTLAVAVNVQAIVANFAQLTGHSAGRMGVDSSSDLNPRGGL